MVSMHVGNTLVNDVALCYALECVSVFWLDFSHLN